MTPEEFLYHEASLLDTHRYEEWLELFSPEATYWLPLEQNQKDPYETSSIIYDDRVLLELRVKQARHARAHARQPLARTVHQVGNIRVAREAGGAGIVVLSNLLLAEFRNDRRRLHAGLVEHHLRPHEQSYKIARKRIDLIDSEGELDGIAVLI